MDCGAVFYFNTGKIAGGMEEDMKIGNLQEFQQGQMSKVERRKQEEKQIKKGIYQMQMLIDCQNMETLDKEREKSRERTEDVRTESGEAEVKKQGKKKADIHTEMKKMMSVAKPNVIV